MYLVVVRPFEMVMMDCLNASAFADATECLLRDSELARKMGEPGRQRLGQEFSAQHKSASTLALYREMLA